LIVSAAAPARESATHPACRIFEESFDPTTTLKPETIWKDFPMVTPITNDKSKALDQALTQIEKQYGRGSIMRLGADDKIADIGVIPTGSLSLDLALGIGGIPRGRVVEIFGPESSGKTTLALHIIAEAQRRGGMAAFIDAEHALDLNYARRLGVKAEDLLISQPDTGEQALEIAEILVRSNALDAIVVDSVAALVPRSEIEGDMGDAQMGSQARLMSQALRKLTAAISKSQTSVIFINQIRMKIGVMFGNPETTTGGNALKFYASQRLDIRKGLPLKDGNDIIGARTKVRVVKNKLAAPFRECEFDVIFGQGISKEGDILDLASDLNLVQKSGSWYSYGSERMAQGRENAKAFLRDHPELLADLENQVRAKHGLGNKAEAEPVAPTGEGS
jgi:recombination protein RecA